MTALEDTTSLSEADIETNTREMIIDNTAPEDAYINISVDDILMWNHIARNEALELDKYIQDLTSETSLVAIVTSDVTEHEVQIAEDQWHKYKVAKNDEKQIYTLEVHNNNPEYW